MANFYHNKMNQILTEYSLYYIFLAILVAGFYAWWLYRQNAQAPWNKTTNYILASLRFILVFLLCFLLLNPFIRQIANEYEKPVIVFAIDNSESMKLATDSTQLKTILQQLKEKTTDLQEKGFEIAIQTFDNILPDFQEVSFNNTTTPLSNLLNGITQSYENKNIHSVVLLSDGIYNQGISPTYQPYRLPIHTILVGDSTQHKDLNLKAVYHNNLAYLGNKFPVEAEIYQTGFDGQAVTVSLKQNGNSLNQQKITFSKNSDFQRITFLLTATQKGMQHYTVEVETLSGEFTTKNNIRHVYVDVIDGKQKILLIAAAPHPDIKAIRSAVEEKELYELDVFIPTVSPENSYKPTEKYDVIIFHNLPNKNGFGSSYFQEYANKGIPIWYIVGTETNLGVLNQQLNFLKINSRGTQYDKVLPSFNTNFNKFVLDDSKQKIIANYPPATTFFATYQLSGAVQVLLYQKIGNVITENPLWLFNDNLGVKTAVLTGEGIWQWRMTENVLRENQETFNDLVLKTIQYLASKDDKRKFRVVPTSVDENTNGSVTFETETYNDSYENIYGKKIDLALTNEKGETTAYTYVNTDANFRYKINGLSQGVYNYKATTELNGKTEISKGQFSVIAESLEALQTRADSELLQQLAQKNGGIFTTSTQLSPIFDKLVSEKPINLIHSAETIKEILHLKWIFFLLIALLSTEWFIRKYTGSY